MKRPVLALGALVALTLAVAMAGSAANLPGGTSIAAAVTSHTDGQTIPEAPFTLTGLATVGVGQPVKNTTLIYIVDVSNSTSSTTGGSLCGRQSAYQVVGNTTLDCELAAVRALNDQAIASGTVAKIGLIVFAGRGTSSETTTNILSAAAADLDPSLAPTSPFVDPDMATFASGSMVGPYVASNNLEWALQSINLASNVTQPSGWPVHGSLDGINLFGAHQVGTTTNYYAALKILQNVLPLVTTPKTQVVFLSDGLPNETVQSQSVSSLLTGFNTSAVTIDTFAVTGAGSTCGTTSPGANGSLEQIAQRFGKHCSALSNPENAVSSVPGVVASKLNSAGLKVDGAAIATDVAPALPQTGPASATLTSHNQVTLAPGDHTLCAFAIGQDGGGGGTTGDNCVTVHVKAAPHITFDGGGDGPGGTAGSIDEGSSFPLDVTLAGTADLTWSATGLPSGTCHIVDPSAAHTAMRCDDDGPATVTLVADDHVNPPVTLVEHVDVRNVAPIVNLVLSPGPHPTGAAVDAHVYIQDPGTNDTFTCQIDSGDGDGNVTAATGTECDFVHPYTAGGLYVVHVTVTDDNGGVGHGIVPLTIDAAPAIDLGFGPGRDGTFGGTEGSLTSLAATIADDGSNTIAWSYIPAAGTDPGASCTFGNASSATTSIVCTDDGDYALVIRVDDGVNPPVEGHAVYHVANAPPVIAAVTPSSSGQTVSVTAAVMDAGSNDSQTCSFAWGDASADTTGVPVVGGTCTASHTYGAGVHSAAVTVTATDDDGGSAMRSASVTLNRAPSCSSVGPSLAELWPPDHTMRLIVLGGASDADGDTVSYAITSVQQDEPTNGLGDGDTAIDAAAAGPGAVRLRAERSGNGDGRVYTIAYTVSDGHSGACSGSVRVTVPKSASKPAVLSPGPGYDSFH